MTIQELDRQAGPTGQVIGCFTIESNGEITYDIAMDGPNSCGIKVMEVPVDKKQTKLSLSFARGRPPLWWNKKLQDKVMLELRTKTMKFYRMYKLRQQKVVPSGLREDLKP